MIREITTDKGSPSVYHIFHKKDMVMLLFMDDEEDYRVITITARTVAQGRVTWCMEKDLK